MYGCMCVYACTRRCACCACSACCACCVYSVVGIIVPLLVAIGYIIICILKRLLPLPPTSGTRGMDAWMLGCLSLCSPGGGCGSNLGCFWEALGCLWCHLGWSLQACGSIWAQLAQAGQPTEPFGSPVRWEHLFREICWIKDQNLGQPVAACCARVDTLQKKIR